MHIFFPSCNYTKASPQNAKITRDFFKERMNVAGCCLYDKKEYTDQDVGFVLCQACRGQLESKIRVRTIWEYFDEDPNFVFPDYKHQKMNLQDCFRDINHPEVHQAVRNILKKMNIDVIEIENNKEKSTFCGTLHFHTTSPIILDLMSQYPDTKLSKMPEEIQTQIMEEYVKVFDLNYPVICDCNRCLKGVTMGGANGVHLLDLIMGKQKSID